MDESPGTVLAIDPATVSGWVLIPDLGQIQYGTLDLSNFKGNRPAILDAFLVWLDTMDKRFVVDVWLYEQPYVQNQRSAYLQYAMIGLIELVAHRGEAVFASIHPSTLKKFATGSGKSDKKAMLAAAQLESHKIETHDQADAHFIAKWWMTEGRYRD
jgi:Holliday junction resolvasome RuvABC endonuclease subunit|tara:strand:- start:167 stop:637 length:471 start_codon:yes stop_codon:yes gene_type:complete